MKNKIKTTIKNKRWIREDPSLDETFRKPNPCRYKLEKISYNETFQNLTLKHFHLNSQYVEIYSAYSKIILWIQNSIPGSSRIGTELENLNFSEHRTACIWKIIICFLQFPILAKSLKSFSRRSYLSHLSAFFSTI